MKMLGVSCTTRQAPCVRHDDSKLSRCLSFFPRGLFASPPCSLVPCRYGLLYLSSCATNGYWISGLAIRVLAIITAHFDEAVHIDRTAASLPHVCCLWQGRPFAWRRTSWRGTSILGASPTGVTEVSHQLIHCPHCFYRLKGAAAENKEIHRAAASSQPSTKCHCGWFS